MKILPHAILCGLVICLCAGCFDHYQRELVVRSADTGKPISGAQVHIEYIGRDWLRITHPSDEHLVTDKAGRVCLEVVDSRRFLPIVSVKADGYKSGIVLPSIFYHHEVTIIRLQRRDPAGPKFQQQRFPSTNDLRHQMQEGITIADEGEFWSTR